MDHSLQSIGFWHLLTDPCAYLQTINCDLQIITVWVDDLLIFTTCDNEMKQTKDQIGTRWQVTNLGKPSKIIGIQIIRDTDSIMIAQCQYIENLLERHQMTHANPVATPMDPNNTPKPSEETATVDRSNPYAQLLGKLQYLTNAMQPDITYAVHKLASYTANPTLEHHSTLKRILRYLKGSKDGTRAVAAGSAHEDVSARVRCRSERGTVD